MAEERVVLSVSESCMYFTFESITPWIGVGFGMQ